MPFLANIKNSMSFSRTQELIRNLPLRFGTVGAEKKNNFPHSESLTSSVDAYT